MSTETETRIVRDALRAAQRGMAVGPAPELRYAGRNAGRSTGLPRFERTPLLVAAAVVALVVAVTAFLQPWQHRADSVPATVYPTVDPATGGHLVSDRAWLDALPAEAADQLTMHGVEPEPVQKVRPADVKVLFAADVAAYDGTADQARLALVRWPTARGASTAWLVGPGRARVGEMSVTRSGDWNGVDWTGFGEGSTGIKGTAEGVVVAAPEGSRVVVRSGNDVTAAGRVERATTQARELWDGIFVAPLPSAAGRLDVSVTTGGKTSADWAYTGSSQDLDAWWDAAAAGARGNPVSTGLTVRGDLATAALQATVLPLTEDSRVLWTDSTGGRYGIPLRDTAVLAIRAPAGGWAIVSVERVQPSRTEFSVEVTAVRTVGAQDPDDLALVFDAGYSAAQPAGLELVGPRSATRARFDTPDGPVYVELSEGAAVGATIPGATEADFQDASGKTLVTVPISPHWPEKKVLAAG